jgi:hypothetical protein
MPAPDSPGLLGLNFRLRGQLGSELNTRSWNESAYGRLKAAVFHQPGVYVMKKTLLVTAATLFVIGQAVAQGQTPPPTQSNQQQNTATQSRNASSTGQSLGTNAQSTQGENKRSAKSSRSMHHARNKHRSHNMAKRSAQHHKMSQASRMQGQPQQQTFGFAPQGQQQMGSRSMSCKKNQKPDGITCM